MSKQRVAVIGGGVVGLACAEALAAAGHDVVLFERHSRVGQETSSRNSEVIHASVYYPPDSLKTTLCLQGRERLLHFCAAHRVPFRLVGKLLVACSQREVEALHTIEARCQTLGAGPRLEPWSAAGIRARAPAVSAVEGLWSAGTGIVDAHGLMAALKASATRRGALILLGHTVVGVGHGRDFTVEVKAGDGARERHAFDAVVNAAGHAADALSREIGLAPPRQVPVKGNYFSLRGPSPVDFLVYPVPVPQLIGLGVHLTVDLAGRARLGPDVEPVDDPQDLAVDPARAPLFLQAARRYLPGLGLEDLQPAYAGVRPKLALDRFADFHIHEATDRGLAGWVDLVGIDSPGLTSSLAIARRVRELIEGRA